MLGTVWGKKSLGNLDFFLEALTYGHSSIIFLENLNRKEAKWAKRL